MLMTVLVDGSTTDTLPGPPDAAECTTNSLDTPEAPAATVRHAENSDVLFDGSVAVAVIGCPPAAAGSNAVKLTLPAPSVVTRSAPSNESPSPLPVGSHAAFEKNSSRNAVFAVLFNVPSRVSVDPATVADVRTGKFCRLF